MSAPKIIHVGKFKLTVEVEGEVQVAESLQKRQTRARHCYKERCYNEVRSGDKPTRYCERHCCVFKFADGTQCGFVKRRAGQYCVQHRGGRNADAAQGVAGEDDEDDGEVDLQKELSRILNLLINEQGK